MLNITMKDITTFWKHVDRSGECWIWTGYRVPFGYGRFGIRGRAINAHRVAWEIAYDPIPTGKHVLHKCDNPPCVRPSHLFVGTNTDNSNDKVAKGRQAFNHGTKSGMAKLDEVKVAAIKARYASGTATLAQLATEHGVSITTIDQIVIGHTWKHVGGSVRKGYAGGARNAMAALTEDQVREIRRRYTPGSSMYALAEEFGVRHNTIWRIVNRKTWRGVE